MSADAGIFNMHMQRQGNNALTNSHLAAVYAIYGIFYKIISWGLILGLWNLFMLINS